MAAIMYLCYLLAYNRGTPIILVILAALVLAYWVNFMVFVNMGFLAVSLPW